MFSVKHSRGKVRTGHIHACRPIAIRLHGDVFHQRIAPNPTARAQAVLVDELHEGRRGRSDGLALRPLKAGAAAAAVASIVAGEAITRAVGRAAVYLNSVTVAVSCNAAPRNTHSDHLIRGRRCQPDRLTIEDSSLKGILSLGETLRPRIETVHDTCHLVDS